MKTSLWIIGSTLSALLAIVVAGSIGIIRSVARIMVPAPSPGAAVVLQPAPNEGAFIAQRHPLYLSDARHDGDRRVSAQLDMAWRMQGAPRWEAIG